MDPRAGTGLAAVRAVARRQPPCRRFGRLRHHGVLLIAAACLAAAIPRNAVAQPPIVAVPFYTPGHFVQGLQRDVMAPAARRFADRSTQLSAALRAQCEPRPDGSPERSRERWADAVDAWERLSTVSVGPLIERRSQRAIDFVPVRPALLERAIESAPLGAAGMERVGSPAKGLPALEWLLWTRPVQAATPACRYAVQVAADVEREATALSSAFAALAERDWIEDEAAVPAMSEAVNQWLGGVQRLRWAQLEKPLRAAGGARGDAAPDEPAAEAPAGAAGPTAGGPRADRAAPAYARAASGLSAAAWAAEWASLRSLGVLAPGAVAPAPGAGVVPLETYLRGRGLNPQADTLQRSVAQADAALRGLSPAAPERVLGAAKALEALAHVVEAEVAPALQVSIGFSDADGD